MATPIAIPRANIKNINLIKLNLNIAGDMRPKFLKDKNLIQANSRVEVLP